MAPVAGNKEWNLLKQQFDELVHDESAAADSIEKILDAEFHRRFGELINRIASNENHARRHG
jgi:hypothetical protein